MPAVFVGLTEAISKAGVFVAADWVWTRRGVIAPAATIPVTASSVLRNICEFLIGPLD
jgi:hypothetical protein